MSMMTELDQTKASSIKHSLMDWRELVIQGNSLLSWEQEWHPFAIVGLVSTAFLSLWYWDPTLISFTAMAGVFLTTVDFFGPKIMNQVFGADSWTSAKERKLDQICEEIVTGTETVKSMMTVIREARARKPIMHFVATCLFFFTLASIGNRINNFFLAYLAANFLVLLPGLYKKGLLQQGFAQVTLKIAELTKGKDHLKKVE